MANYGGSSPRTWGTRATDQASAAVQRFIPTHMGNADSRPEPILPASVHPHAHGERLVAGPRVERGIGSSPRTWGTLWVQAFEAAADRFIPTHMGNARRAALLNTRYPVHPHAHGERVKVGVVTVVEVGSSPRTWGTHRPAPGGHHAGRFIPTHMGNAAVSSATVRWLAVHPHAHGERW